MVYTQGTPQIEVPPSIYPANWTQTMIEAYEQQFYERKNAGLPNFAPWWLTNPEWSAVDVAIVPKIEITNVGTGDTSHINPATGAWVDNSGTPIVQGKVDIDMNLLMLMILLSQRSG